MGANIFLDVTNNRAMGKEKKLRNVNMNEEEAFPKLIFLPRFAFLSLIQTEGGMQWSERVGGSRYKTKRIRITRKWNLYQRAEEDLDKNIMTISKI